MYGINSLYSTISIGNSYEFHHRVFGIPSSPLQEPPNPNYAASSEMAVFFGNQNGLVITPHRIDQIFLEDLHTILNLRIQNLSVSKPTGYVCLDVLQSDLSTLIDQLQTDFILLPYGISPQFYNLLQKLQEMGCSPIKRTYPLQEDSWTINFIDSKIGGHLILSKVAESFSFFSMPFAAVAETQDNLLQIVTGWAKRDFEFVIKPNHGHGGRQIYFYSLNERKLGINPLISKLEKAFSFDPYYQFAPYIVEQLINDPGSYPVNINGQIDEEGSVLIEGSSKLVTKSDFGYVGAEIGKNVIDIKLQQWLEMIANSIGSEIARLGYVGWFDVDLVYDQKNNKLYGLEINARTTGVTYLINIAKFLYGSEWMKKGCLLSVDRFFLKSPIDSYRKISGIISSINYQYSTENAGIVPVVTKALATPTPYLGYVVFGPQLETAYQVKTEFENMLAAL